MKKIKYTLFLLVLTVIISCSTSSSYNMSLIDLLSLYQGLSPEEISNLGFELGNHISTLRDNTYSMPVKIKLDKNQYLYPKLYFNDKSGLIGYYFKMGEGYSDLQGNQILKKYLKIIDFFSDIYGPTSVDGYINAIRNKKLATSLYLESANNVSTTWRIPYGVLEITPIVSDISLEYGACYYFSCHFKYMYYDYYMHGDYTRYQGPFGLEMGCSRDEFINSGLGPVKEPSYVLRHYGVVDENEIELSYRPKNNKTSDLANENLLSIKGRFDEQFGLTSIKATYAYTKSNEEDDKQLEEFYSMCDYLASMTGASPEMSEYNLLNNKAYGAFWRLPSSNNNEIRNIIIEASLQGITTIEFTTVAN